MSYVKVKGEVVAVLPAVDRGGNYMIALASEPALILRTPGPSNLMLGDAVEVELPNVLNVSAWSVKKLAQE